jgi:hypothetical protein
MIVVQFKATGIDAILLEYVVERALFGVEAT